MSIESAIAMVDAGMPAEGDIGAGADPTAGVPDGGDAGGGGDVEVPDLAADGSPKEAEPAPKPKSAIAEKHQASLERARQKWAADKARKQAESRESRMSAREKAAERVAAEGREAAELLKSFTADPIGTLKRAGVPISAAYKALTDELVNDDKPVTLTRAEMRALEQRIAEEAAKKAAPGKPKELSDIEKRLAEAERREQVRVAEAKTREFVSIVSGEGYEDLLDSYGEDGLIGWGVKVAAALEEDGKDWTPEIVAAHILKSHNDWEAAKAARAAQRKGAAGAPPAKTAGAEQSPKATVGAPAPRKPSTSLSNSLASGSSVATRRELSQQERLDRLAAQIDAEGRQSLR